MCSSDLIIFNTPNTPIADDIEEDDDNVHAFEIDDAKIDVSSLSHVRVMV